MKNFAVFIISIFTLICSANAQNWTSGITDEKEAAYIASVNESDSLLGKYCFFETNMCSWLLMHKTACEEKERYPAILNTEGSALAIEIVCFGATASGRYRYAIAPFDAANQAIVYGKTVGIVFPLKSGEFRVNRFNLIGFKEKHDKLLEFFIQRTNSKNKDQTL